MVIKMKKFYNETALVSTIDNCILISIGPKI